MSLGREIHENTLRNIHYFEICKKMRHAGITVSNDDFAPFIEDIYQEIKKMVDDYYLHNLKETYKTRMSINIINEKTQNFIDLHKHKEGMKK